MSSTIGTNVVADENQISSVINAIGKIFEDAYLKDTDQSKKAKLNRKCVEMVCGKGNNQASFKVIKKEYIKEIEAQLEKDDIPFFTLPNGLGDYLVIVPKTYENEFIKAQEVVMCTSTDYMSTCEAKHITESAKNMGYNSIISYEFTDLNAANLAVAKLFQNQIPSGFVDNKDGTYTVYPHPRTSYRENGIDLASFQLDMAYEASKGMFKGSVNTNLDTPCNSLLDLRLAQARYDDNEIEKFAELISKGESGVLGDVFGSSLVYLESRKGQLSLYKKDTKTNRWFSEDLGNCKNKDSKALKHICTLYTDQISNMKVVNSLTEWNESYKNKIYNENEKLDPNHGSYEKDRRPVILKGATGSLEENERRKLETYAEFGKKEVREFLKDVSLEASRLTSSKFGKINATDGDYIKNAYEYKKEMISSILSNKNNHLVMKFLYDSNPNISVEIKEKWIQEIADIFNEEKEIPGIDMYVKEDKVKDVKNHLKEMETLKQYEIHYTNPEKEQSKDIDEEFDIEKTID